MKENNQTEKKVEEEDFNLREMTMGEFIAKLKEKYGNNSPTADFADNDLRFKSVHDDLSRAYDQLAPAYQDELIKILGKVVEAAFDTHGLNDPISRLYWKIFL